MSSLRSEQSLTGRLIAKGRDGKSAYDYARLGGYEGTEEEFIELLTREIPSRLSDLEGPLPEDCKPDWDETDDMSSAYIKNKPFGEETTTSSKDILITWDGDTTDKAEAITGYGSGTPIAYKVSDKIFTCDQLLKMEIDTVSETGKKIEDGRYYDADGAVMWGYNGFASVSVPGTYTMPGGGKFIYPETGIYFPEDYRALRTIEPIVLTETTIEKIDEKFIPDTIVREASLIKEMERAKAAESSLKDDLEQFANRPISYDLLSDKPFGEEASEVEVIPETKVTVSTQGSRSYGKLTGINTSILSFNTSYTVEFDGTTYEIISVSDTLTGGACLGNRIGEDDGYSFGIIDDADGYSPAGEEGVYLFADAGEHTVRVYTKKITIIPLEEKYMPDHNHSWFDLSDKPFGDLDLEYLYNGPITVNDTTASFTMNNWFDGNYTVKAILSDIKGIAVYETEGKSVSALQYGVEMVTFDDVHFPISEITMTDKSSITYTATFRESMSGEYILKLYRADQQTIQYLEDRYLSSNIVRKEDLSNISHDMLKDRPFYRDEILTSIIQQSTTSITIHDNGIGTQFTELNSQARGEYLQDEDRLIAGVLYKVTINDLSYELTAYTNEQINHTVLGNAALINSSYATQNQLPFVFYTGPGMVYMHHETPGTYEVGIYGLEINLKQIDPRVIPEDYINKLIDAKLATLNSNTTTN